MAAGKSLTTIILALPDFYASYFWPSTSFYHSGLSDLPSQNQAAMAIAVPVLILQQC